MTKKQVRQLETAGKKLEKCGGDCRHCDKCHIYTRWTERAGYMAVGCDLLPSGKTVQKGPRQCSTPSAFQQIYNIFPSSIIYNFLHSAHARPHCKKVAESR